MKKKFVSLFLCISTWFSTTAQDLQHFSVNLNMASSNYLSISQKKSYSVSEAGTNKSAVDLALLTTDSWGSRKMEWYNMSGKDEKIPAEVRGTSTLINAISLDREQFDKCKSTQDLKRMTGYITRNSLSHFASVGEKEVSYHCFIFQLENGKRGLLWIDAVDKVNFKVMVKMED